MDHSLWLSDFERQIRDLQEDWETWFSIPHLWPINSHYETASIAMLILDTNEDSFDHLCRGENVTSSPGFTSGGGFKNAQQYYICKKESTLINQNSKKVLINLDLHFGCVCVCVWVHELTYLLLSLCLKIQKLLVLRLCPRISDT